VGIAVHQILICMGYGIPARGRLVRVSRGGVSLVATHFTDYVLLCCTRPESLKAGPFVRPASYRLLNSEGIFILRYCACAGRSVFVPSGGGAFYSLSMVFEHRSVVAASVCRIAWEWPLVRFVSYRYALVLLLLHVQASNFLAAIYRRVVGGVLYSFSRPLSHSRSLIVTPYPLRWC
jgi:hypothetical protein